MARPSQMAPRMQVQSAIASPPACGRVCAHLSCLVLHARTLRLSQPAWLRRPFAPAAAPLSLLPRNRWQAAAATRARRARRNPRARARGGWVHWGGELMLPPLPRPGMRRHREVAGARMASGWSGSGESASERLLASRTLMERGAVVPKSCAYRAHVLALALEASQWSERATALSPPNITHNTTGMDRESLYLRESGCLSGH